MYSHIFIYFLSCITSAGWNISPRVLPYKFCIHLVDTVCYCLCTSRLISPDNFWCSFWPPLLSWSASYAVAAWAPSSSTPRPVLLLISLKETEGMERDLTADFCFLFDLLFSTFSASLLARSLMPFYFLLCTSSDNKHTQTGAAEFFFGRKHSECARKSLRWKHNQEINAFGFRLIQCLTKGFKP